MKYYNNCYFADCRRKESTLLKEVLSLGMLDSVTQEIR